MREWTKLFGEAVLLLGVAAVGGEPRKAAACSCTAQPIYESQPEAGATGVALNQAVMLLGNFVPDSITFEEAGGKAVAFDATHGPTPTCPGSLSELIPRQPLQPNTKYVVRVRSTAAMPTTTASLEFTTGTQRLSDPPLDPPQGQATLISDVPEDGFSCGEGTVYTCLILEDDKNTEIIARRGSETLLRWMANDTENAFKLERAPDCVEVRRRSPTGKRSEPLSICGAALHARTFQADDRDPNGVLHCPGAKRIDGSPMVSRPTTSAPPDASVGIDPSPEPEPPTVDAGEMTSTSTRPRPPPMASAADGCSVTDPRGTRPWPLLGALLGAYLLLQRRRAR